PHGFAITLNLARHLKRNQHWKQPVDDLEPEIAIFNSPQHFRKSLFGLIDRLNQALEPTNVVRLHRHRTRQSKYRFGTGAGSAIELAKGVNRGHPALFAS